MTRTRVAFLLPHFRAGGAERCVLNWLRALDRTRFAPFLMLTRIDGAFLADLPADVMPIALGGGRALTLPRRIARALIEHRIDVAYSATNAMNLALLAAPVRRSQRIASEHTPTDLYLAEAKWRPLRTMAMRLLYPHAAAIAVPTEAVGASLATALGRDLPVAVLPNPVVEQNVRQPRTTSSRPLRLAAAGRLVPAKAFDVLIAAIAQVPDVTLTIHGDGPLRDALATAIDTAGVSDRVTLAGHSGQLSARLAEADLFVLPSRREGFGNVIIEAMAVGTPVLATRSGGTQEIVTDGVNGHLVVADDAAALADQIAALRDHARRAATVEAGYATAARYDVAGSTAALEALLTRIGGTRSTRA